MWTNRKKQELKGCEIIMPLGNKNALENKLITFRF